MACLFAYNDTARFYGQAQSVPEDATEYTIWQEEKALSETVSNPKTTVTYEKIYYTLWELSQRYQEFCQFRVIGNSHDERMIPMLEVGKGAEMIFCVAGLDGTQKLLPGLLLKMIQEYCTAYECRWQLEDFYDVKKLLDKIRICMIPLENPDGYEICRAGFSSIRNPIFRQMLRMQSIPARDFGYNARGMDLLHNFPTTYYRRSRMGEQPASENETKALIRIIQEYGGKGLLDFGQSGREIVYYHSEQGLGMLPRSHRLARHMQRTSSYHLEKEPASGTGSAKMGTLEQYYIQTVKQPAFLIRTPAVMIGEDGSQNAVKKIYEEIRLLPLEYIFSLNRD